MKMPTRIRPSITTKSCVVSIPSRLVINAGPTLKSASAKPMAIANAKMIWPRDSSKSSSPSSVLRRVVRRDGEGAETDGERLAERDHAADDGQPVDPPLRHRRGDDLADLRDLAVGLAHGHRPIRRRAHHHALEDGLPSDGHAQRS